MREIKFRACDGSQMITGFADERTPNYVINLDGSIGYYSEDGDFYRIENSDLVLMQYTGLKDKNGKEIYEGDIVKWKSGKHCDSYGGIVNKDYVTKVEYHYAGFKPFTDSEGYGGVEMFYVQDCEVIGNIYENPELLNEN